MKSVAALALMLFSLSTFASTSNNKTPYAFPRTLEQIEFRMTPAMEGDMDLAVSLDLTEDRPVLAGDFAKLDSNGEVASQCKFSNQLSDEETTQLKHLLASTRYCRTTQPDDMAMDPYYLEFLKAYTKKPTHADAEDGKGVELNKYFIAGMSPQRYLCRGGQDLYKFLKSVTAKRAPKNCPRQYNQMFAFQAP